MPTREQAESALDELTYPNHPVGRRRQDELKQVVLDYMDQAAGDIDATSAAVELADEHGIDLLEVEGTGKDGRITKSDVQAAIE